MTEPRRLYERIARKLAKAIEDGVYEVGQRLPPERPPLPARAKSPITSSSG